MSSAMKNLIITGSNTGLGFLAANQLGGEPYHIIVTSRTLAKAKEAVDKLTASSKKATYAAYELDVANATSVSTFGDQVRAEYDHVDVLVNNAGINNDPGNSGGRGNTIAVDDTSAAATQKRFDLGHQLFATNVIGTNALTYQILPLLKKSNEPRLIFTTSGLGSIGMNVDPSAEWYQVDSSTYRASKAALNMLMTCWHKKLKDEGISVWAVCPGWNATNFGGNDGAALRKFGAQDPEVGAGIIVDVVLGKRTGEEGKVVAGDGKIRPW